MSANTTSRSTIAMWYIIATSTVLYGERHEKMHKKKRRKRGKGRGRGGGGKGKNTPLWLPAQLCHLAAWTDQYLILLETTKRNSERVWD